MRIEEYTEAGHNFRLFVTLEKEYLQLFVNATALLIAGFWFVSAVVILRYAVCVVGIFLAFGMLITELRYATYFKHFFSVSVSLEKDFDGRQLTDITRHFKRPFLGIRSTNVIIAFYCVTLFFWAALALSDLFELPLFHKLLAEISNAKLSLK